MATKFLVAYPAMAEIDGDDGDVAEEPDVKGICPCEDTRGVAACIAKAWWAGTPWAVFELVDCGKGQTAVRRAVVLKWDGKALYDVEISR